MNCELTYTDMNITESIRRRSSVRTYTGAPLSDVLTGMIKQYISHLRTPFGEKARVELIRTHTDGEKVKLGTYGWVKGAREYLALIHEDSPFAETAAAYMFEELILYCTFLGLGTCWLGGSFSRTDFKKQLQLKPNERLKIVSPVGYIAGGKERFLEKYVVQAKKHHASRKPFGEIFFDGAFNRPLTTVQAGVYLEPLEMVRLAPSANNTQEWRVLLDGEVLHFYKKPYLSFDSIDIGIALCHFELTCRELGMAGRFEAVECIPPSKNLQYVISWVPARG